MLYKENYEDHTIINDGLILQLNIALGDNTVYFLDPYNNKVKQKINDDIKQYAKQRNESTEVETSLTKRILRNSFILCMREMLAEREVTNKKVEDVIKWNEILKKEPSILKNEEFILTPTSFHK